MSQLYPLIAAEVGGVRTWWVERPASAALRASLIWRLGAADQRLTTSGWPQLLLGQALSGLEPPPYLDVEGSVGAAVSRLSISGPPEEVATWLSRVTSRLCWPDQERVREQAAALQRSSAVSGAIEDAWLWRFGTRGVGATCSGLLGLLRVTAAELAGAAQAFLNTASAVLVLDGPPPKSLQLDLPRAGGPPHALDLAPLRRTPGAYPHPWPSVVLSGVLEHSAAAVVTARLLEARVFAELRNVEGISYSPQVGYVPLARQAMVTLEVDVEPGSERRVVAALPEALARLAATGPDPDELAEQIDAEVESLFEIDAYADAAQRATAELTGRPVRTGDQLIEEARALTPGRIVEQAECWQRSALLGFPPKTWPPPGYPALDEPPVEELEAAQFESFFSLTVDDPFELRLAATGLQRLAPRSSLVIGRDDLAGYLAWPDGRREIVRTDGTVLAIEPTLCSMGRELIRSLDEWADPALHLEMAARDPATIPMGPDAIAESAVLDRRARALADGRWWLAAAAGAFVLVDLLFQLVVPGFAPDRSWRVAVLGVPVAVIGYLGLRWAERRLARDRLDFENHRRHA